MFIKRGDGKDTKITKVIKFSEELVSDDFSKLDENQKDEKSNKTNKDNK